MLIRSLIFFGFMAAGTHSAVLAAPVPSASKEGGPQIVAQAASAEQLIAKVKQALRPILGERTFATELEQMLDVSKLPGIDPKRPFGFYAKLDAGLLKMNFENSTAVLMVPVKDEKTVITALGQIPEIQTQKKEEGLYDVTIKEVPVPLGIRFAKEYAYVSIAGPGLEAKRLLDPKDVLDPKDQTAFTLVARVDAIPEELKKAAIDFVDQSFAELKKGNLGKQELALLEPMFLFVNRYLKLGLNDAREYVVRFDVDPKTGEVFEEITLDGKPNSELSKIIAGMKPTKNDFAGLAGPDSVGHVMVRAPLFAPELRNLFSGLTDLGINQVAEQLKNNAMPAEAGAFVTELLKALQRTVKTGDMDMGVALRGPNKEGFYGVIAAVRMKDTAGIEKSLRAAVKIAPKMFQDTIKVDAGKIEGMAVHEIDVSADAPEEVKRVFGKTLKVYVMFAPDAVYGAFGVDGMTLLNESLKSKAALMPVMQVQVSGTRLEKLIRQGHGKEGPNPILEGFLKRLAQQPKLTFAELQISGGSKLTVRYNLTGVVYMIGSAVLAFDGVGPGATPPKVAPVPAVEKK